MSCPACGGHERNLVAPGYWECCSLVEERRQGLVPNPGGPAGAMMPVEHISRHQCGVRYSDGGTGGNIQSCACGTFAIGACADCGLLVCGDHSRLYKGRRLCSEHVRAMEEAVARATVKARLTVEKFLALAATSGNPGLKTWTIKELGEVPYTSWERLRKKTRYALGVVGEHQLRGWVILSDSFTEILGEDGRILAVAQHRVDGENLRSPEKVDKLTSHDFTNEPFGFEDHQPEYQDRILRHMCERYNIAI